MTPLWNLSRGLTKRPKKAGGLCPLQQDMQNQERGLFYGARLNRKGAAEAAPLVSMSVRTVQFLKRTDTQVLAPFMISCTLDFPMFSSSAISLTDFPSA